MVNPSHQPVIVIGAGVSGLLLAQHLREWQIPFRVFERDLGHAYRGVGWGLSLHWSLPAVRRLLPDDLVRRLPEAYVDRLAVENGESSAFPFFDLASGELVAETPKAPESDRIRVSRQRLLQILATGIDVQVRGFGISKSSRGKNLLLTLPLARSGGKPSPNTSPQATTRSRLLSRTAHRAWALYW